MGGRVSISRITVDTMETEDKNLIIYLSDDSNIKLKLYEKKKKVEVSEYIDKDEYEIDFCLGSPYSGVYECANLFNVNDDAYFTSELNKYVITAEGSPCTSLTFRPGSILYETDRWLDGRTFEGRRCKIMYRGYPMTSDILLDCCLKNRVDGCNKDISNNYTTSHCNTTMVDYCRVNYNNELCMSWLQNRTEDNDDTALRLYLDICKNNHNSNICSYFCMFSRKHGFFNYCDSSLNEWCNNNINNNNCVCLLTPDSLVGDLEQLLGPKECWLNECNVDTKWLTSDQIEKKKGCNVTSCIVNIDSISSTAPTLDIVNQCSTSSQLTINNLSSREENISSYTYIWGVVQYIISFLMIVTLGAIIIMYNRSTTVDLIISS